MRVGQNRWFNLLWLLPIGFVLLLAAIATAKGLRGTDAVRGFTADHPGAVGPGAGDPVGTPWWVGVTHFLNLFLMAFILRSGLQIFADHPRLY